MKKEDLYDGITDIKDEFIEEAGKYRFASKRKKWIASLSSIAAVLVVGFLGIIAIRDGNLRKYTVADTAEYVFETAPTSMDFANGEEPAVDFSQVNGAPTITIRSDLEVDKEMEDRIEFSYEKGGDLYGNLFSAELPEMAECPNADDEAYSDDWSKYSEDNAKWRESLAKQRAVNGTMNSENDGFSANFLRMTLENSKKENVIVSPINVYMALGMLAEVTEGNSRAQVLGAINEADLETLSSNVHDLWNYNYVDDGKAKSLLGSSIWLRNGTEYRMDTLERLSQLYYADSFSGEMGSKEYNDSFHNWLNNHTGNLLKDQIDGIDLDPETIAAICSTLYFKSAWTEEFYDGANSEEIFHSAKGDVKTTFMNKSERGRIYFGEHFAAASLQMEDNYSMMFLLPDEGVAPETLLEDEDAMHFILTGEDCESKIYKVNYSIPKFDVESQLSLIDTLKKMGVSDVFDSEKSDFSALTEEEKNIVVSEILHGARVKIDEEGCEAAAYTVIMMKNTAIMVDDEKYSFVADRPFIFVIRNEANLPLFVGIVNTID